MMSCARDCYPQGRDRLARRAQRVKPGPFADVPVASWLITLIENAPLTAFVDHLAPVVG
jgi:hypothetical protein